LLFWFLPPFDCGNEVLVEIRVVCSGGRGDVVTQQVLEIFESLHHQDK
jgi:hypothetical protein